MQEAGAPVWAEGEACPTFGALDGDVAADVCVVGLGGSGLEAVHELLRMGRSVVGLDAGAVACAAAGRNGGFLLAGTALFHHEAVQAFGRERAVVWYRETLDELDRIAADVPDAVRRTGSLRIAADDAELDDCRAQLDAMRADALPVGWYEGDEGVGLLFPLDAVFQPLRRCRVLALRAARAGARLFENAAALEIGAREVRTPRGRVACERVIVAVDGRLETLLPELEGRVRTARLNMLATAPARDVSYTRPVYYRYGYEYWQQLDDGRIALGGFRDRAGEAEWTADATPSPDVQRMLEEFLRERVRTAAPITHRWAASVGFTPDYLPICEEVRDGVWAVGGYSGTGNVIGALCGRAAARLASGARDADVPSLARAHGGRAVNERA